MDHKICPECGVFIPWDGLGWTCRLCGHSIEPTPEEVKEAMEEKS